MTLQQQWLEDTCSARTYKKLYAVGMEISRGDPQIRDFLPDAIQDVFLLLCKRHLVLINHEAIEGWLIVALKLRIKDIRRSFARHSKQISFSLDDDTRLIDRLQAEAFSAIAEQSLFEQLEERLESIEESIGSEDMRLLKAYYSAVEKHEATAQSFGLSAAALRKRVNRICIKIRSMDIVLIIFLVVKSQSTL